MRLLLQHGVSRQAEQRPGSPAVVYQGAVMSYGELEAASNRLARLLRASDCARGDRVALMVPKSPDAIVAMLGTLKADCVYVPVDTSMPAPRVAKILHRSGARWILATGAAAPLVCTLFSDGTLSQQRIRVGWLGARSEGEPGFAPDFSRDEMSAHSAEARDYENGAEDAAHILFTSGSTGEPKGVVITHSNVLHFLDWALEYFGICASDRNSGHPPLHFDLSTFDVYGTLTAGAQLHLPTPELNLLPHKLAAFIRDSALTQWFSVPSILNYMAKFDVVRDDDFPALKRLLWCGEVFPTPALIYWMKKLRHVTFTNLYGPTEATIASSYHTVATCPEHEDDAIPIGRACGGEELLVLDEALKQVTQGEVGDLYIRGAGLSPGYWQDPEKTAVAFLPNPYSTDAADRIYKTGDLARVNENGLVYYVGRADSQIKSRGYRIELGEIEVALNSVASLVEVAVVAAKTDGFEGTVICCAFVPSPGSGANAVALRKTIGAVLPAYMLPTRWMQMDKLPKNQNGKIDRRRLKESFERGEDQVAIV